MPYRYKQDGRWTPAFDPERCAASVHERGRGYRRYQCQNRHKPESEWCGVHSPEAEAKREAKSIARSKARFKPYEEAARVPKLEKALALYRSMVLSGEYESPESKAAYNEAMEKPQ